jgi:hypothetical protein
LWNAVDMLSGGRTPAQNQGGEFFGQGTPDEYRAGGGAYTPDVGGMASGPLRFAPELGQGKPIPQPSDGSEAKGLSSLLPLLLGLGAGGIGLAMGGLAPAIIAGLGTMGASQLAGEATNPGEYNPADTGELYHRAGIDSNPFLNTVTEMALDPMNLMGVAAGSKLGQAGAAADLGRAEQTGARLGSLAEQVRNPSLGAARMGGEGLGAGQSLGFGRVAAEAPESELLNAIDEGVLNSSGTVNHQDMRRRLMEMMGEKANTPTATAWGTLSDLDLPALPIPGRTSGLPVSSPTLMDMDLPALPIPGRTPGLPPTATPTLADFGIPLPIQKTETSKLPRSAAEILGYLKRFPNSVGAGL